MRNRLLKQIRNLEETLEKQNRMQEQVGSLEDTVKERELQCNRLQQQLEALQGAANERDQLQKDVVQIKEERDSLQKRAAEMERRSKAAPGLDQSIQAKEAGPETELDDNSNHPNTLEASRLRYCNACLKSVDKMSADVRLLAFNPMSLLISATGSNQTRREMQNQRGGICPLHTGRSKSRKGEAK